MEYANNGTLEDLIKARGNSLFSNSELKEFFLQLANGMKDISQANVIHRDIKAENVLILDNILKISDFGLSKITTERTRQNTFKGFGTQSYAAPELWEESTNTPQMDMYSMGILFYILATLKYPYDLDQVDGNTPDQKYRNAHIYKAQIDPSKINKNLPIDFVILINTLLAKRPHDRFKNWNEIIEKVNNADCENHLKSSSLTDIILKTSNKFISENEKKNNEKKLKLEKENNFLKRIYSVYENEIYNNIDQLIKELNFRDKRPIFDIQKIESSSNAPLFGFKIMFFHKIIITGKFEILNEKNFMKRVKIPDSFDPFSKEYMYQDTPVIPKINNKKILAWGEVHNHNAFLQGFNIFFFHNENSMYCDLEYAEFTIPNSRSIRYWNHDPQKLVSDLGLTLEELKFYSDDLNSSDFLFKIENKRFNSDKLETFLNSTVSFLDNNKD